LLTPQPTWVEQDPEELWRAVVKTIRTVIERLPPDDRIIAISQSSQAGTTIPVDDAGKPTHNTFSWMDQRAHAEAARVQTHLGADFIYTTTGWRLQNGLPLQHIAWFKKNRPQDFAATRRFLFVNDFIAHRLTGKFCTNPSDAGLTQLANLDTADWDDRLLDFIGIDRNQLSPIHPSGAMVGRVTATASQTTGLPENVPVINGAHDQYCAALGVGVLQPSQVLLSCGTAWVLLTVPHDQETGLASRMAVSRHIIPGRWGAIRSLGGVGRSLEWLLDNFWNEHASDARRAALYNAVSDAAGRIAPGANGLFFIPLAGGHRATNSKGGWIHLTLAHTRADMARAVMEGVAFELRWAIQEIQRAGVQVSELIMVGGAAKSATWTRIVADVTGLPVILPAIKQAASLGAAILAGVGAGVFANPESGFAAMRGEQSRIAAVAETHARYGELYAAYHRLAECLAE
jgi:xylulokinase